MKRVPGYLITFYLLNQVEGKAFIYNSPDGIKYEMVCDYGNYEKLLKELITKGSMTVKKDKRKKYNDEIIKIKKFKRAKDLINDLVKLFNVKYKSIYYAEVEKIKKNKEIL